MDRRPTCTKAITGEAGDIHDAYAHDIRTRAHAADVVTTLGLSVDRVGLAPVVLGGRRRLPGTGLGASRIGVMRSFKPGWLD